MKINKNYKATFKPRDVFFHVLYHWRSILLVALVFGLAFGVYQFFFLKLTHDAGKLTDEERAYQNNIRIYEARLGNARSQANNLTNMLASQQTYQEESIYFSLNAQNVWIAESVYLVEGDQENASPGSVDPADKVLPAYSAPLTGDLDEEELKAAFNTDRTEYVNELITTELNTSDNTIKVRVLAGTRENAESSMAFIHQQMEKIASGKASEIAPHRLILLNTTVSLGADKDLDEKKTLMNESIQLSTELLTNAQGTLRELDNEKAMPKAPGSHIPKMIIIGFLVGGILMVMFYLFRHEMSGLLKNGEEMIERFGVSVLGRISHSEARHPERGIDKLLYRWENGSGNMKDSLVYDNIAGLIREKDNVGTIILTSTLSKEEICIVQEELALRLDGYEIMTEADFLNNPEVLKKAGDTDGIVLVEGKGISRILSMERMAEVLSMSSVDVLGAIIL